VIVVDTNIIAYLYLRSHHGLAAAEFLARDANWVAPVLWRSEFRNVLAAYLRRREIQVAEARAIQSAAEDFMREGERQVDSDLVLGLVDCSDCSAYDCEYVALAKQLGVKLVTMDRKVLRTFPEVAVPLVGATA
jgi:predicted nucleic acid-binding protein